MPPGCSYPLGLPPQRHVEARAQRPDDARLDRAHLGVGEHALGRLIGERVGQAVLALRDVLAGVHVEQARGVHQLAPRRDERVVHLGLRHRPVDDHRQVARDRGEAGAVQARR